MSIRKRHTSTRGATLTGYALLVGLIGIVALASIDNIGSQVQGGFGEVDARLVGVVGDRSGSADEAPQPSPDNIVLNSDWTSDERGDVAAGDPATTTITVSGLGQARQASVTSGTATIDGQAGPVSITPDGSGTASFDVTMTAPSPGGSSTTATIQLGDQSITLTLHSLPDSFATCSDVRNAPGSLPSGSYTVDDPNLSNSSTYSVHCDVGGPYSSCTDAANQGANTDGIYNISGTDAFCRFNVDGGNWQACLYRQRDQRDLNNCLGTTAARWLISDGTGRTFIADGQGSNMLWPSSGGEDTYNASWRQVEPSVSPSISGSNSFCLSSRTYLGSSGRSVQGMFAFANSGSANSGSFQGCVTSLDSGQYFGGHSTGIGEARWNGSSWVNINSTPGVLSPLTAMFPN
ncbi:MAG: hypothetical protein Alpg2KO_13320 [Alphaproteobacteria bacterium]